MLRTLLVGAAAAFIGRRVIKMNEEGKLDSLKAQLRDGVDRVRTRLQDQPDALLATANARPLPTPPKAAKRARKSADPMEVSKPAKAHPWPADPRAMPEES